MYMDGPLQNVHLYWVDWNSRIQRPPQNDMV